MSRSAFALAALFVLAGCGSAHHASRPPATPDLLVVSSWGSHGSRITSGGLATDPKRGFVLYQSGRDTPTFFSTSGRNGPLRLIAAGPSNWVFKTPSGMVSSVDTDGPYTYYFELGRRLDPAHLPPLALHGAAIPIEYGPRQEHAVMLVGLVTKYGYGTWTSTYGFLPGYQLPARRSIASALQRPLLGPHGTLWRIDRRAHRLVRIPGHGRPPRWIPPHEGCSKWPQPDGSRYVACPTSIVHEDPAGTQHVITREPRVHIEVTWPFLAPSPDGKTLLAEYDASSCGTHQSALFVNLATGKNQPALAAPDPPNPPIWFSEPIGWLPGKRFPHALIGGQAPGPMDCAGDGGGVYDAYVNNGGSASLVAATNMADATTW